MIPTPVVGYGMVFCSSGPRRPDAGDPAGRQRATSRRVISQWSRPRGSPFVPSPILYGEHLYMVNDMAEHRHLLEASSGKSCGRDAWAWRSARGFSASPVALDGKVFFTNDEGETFVLKAGPDFELLHVNSIGEKTLASPALVDGRWYIRTDRNLYAIGRSYGPVHLDQA